MRASTLFRACRLHGVAPRASKPSLAFLQRRARFPLALCSPLRGAQLQQRAPALERHRDALALLDGGRERLDGGLLRSRGGREQAAAAPSRGQR